MNPAAKVTSKGQITLPVKLRSELGVKPGDVVEFSRNENGKFEITAKKETLGDLRGAVKLERKITARELDSWVDDARAARGRSADR